MRALDGRLGRAVVLAVAALLVASAAFSQWSRGGGGWGRSRYPPRLRPADHRDDGFAVCRLRYTRVRREESGSGWSTDYPFADINFMIRVRELTRTPIDTDENDDPNHWVIDITDPGLLGCPFVVASDVGTIGLSDEEVVRLREYLLKGGFLWVDDFWGTPAWDQWTSEMSRVLSPAEFPIVDVPLNHEIFRGLYTILEIPQISNIRFWRRTGGATTSERGMDSAEPHFRTIADANGRIMVVMTHNTDIQDSWEREGEERQFFERFSPDGYALGINVLLYAMTH